jgi:hypothetical protein
VGSSQAARHWSDIAYESAAHWADVIGVGMAVHRKCDNQHNEWKIEMCQPEKKTEKRNVNQKIRNFCGTNKM